MCRPFPLMPGPNHRVVQVKRQLMYGALQVRRRFDVNPAGKKISGHPATFEWRLVVR